MVHVCVCCDFFFIFILFSDCFHAVNQKIWILYTTFRELGFKHLELRWEIFINFKLYSPCWRPYSRLSDPIHESLLHPVAPQRRASTWLLLYAACATHPSTYPTLLIISPSPCAALRVELQLDKLRQHLQNGHPAESSHTLVAWEWEMRGLVWEGNRASWG